jgi:4-hydroxy-3-methylbut-2-enyl diphosphate reductase IspH
MVLLGSIEEAEALELPDSTRVAVVTQTTLSVDDTSEAGWTRLPGRFAG